MTEKLAALAALKASYVKARKVYDNTGEETMTDAEFDKLEDRIRKIEPTWSVLKKTGSGVVGKKKPVKLPQFMPSLNKCKVGENDLAKFVGKAKKFDTGLVVMDKLDGSSVFASYVKGELAMLATRGDGETGKDITFLAPNLTRLPKGVSSAFTGEIRMEAVITKKVFAKKWADEGFSSARAMVSGVLNRQGTGEIDFAMPDIHFVCLRLLTLNGRPEKLHTGLALLHKIGFEVVNFSALPRMHETEEALVTRLVTSVKNSLYDMDGLVVHADTSALPEENDKPDFAFAFKQDLDVDSAPQTTVREIVWKVSAFGTLVPKAIVDPVDFDGVTVKQCALHNVSWAIEKGVGVGAVVGILRSGEIIPKIVKVYKKAKLKMPDRSVYGEYEWDATGTNFVLVKGTETSTEVSVQVLNRFFRHCELDAFGPSLAAALVGAGYTTTDKLVTMSSAEDWLGEVTDSATMAARYAKEICNYRVNASLPATMAASGCFNKGVGRTRIQSLLTAHPKLFSSITFPTEAKRSGKEVSELAKSTPGCGNVFATALLDGWPAWVNWLVKSKMTFASPKRKVPVTGKLEGALVSFTGYRDAEQEAWISENGGTVVSFGAKTNILLFKSGGKASGKVASAQAKGIKVMQFDQLKKGQ